MNDVFLVTGACGYIGSHLVWKLRKQGRRIVAFDNLSSGKPSRIPSDVPLVIGDIRNIDDLERVNNYGKIDLIFNLAALKSPEESVKHPNLYFDVNQNGVLTLLKFMKKQNVRALVQSSSSSVYGNASTNLIGEDSNLEPISPYGESKLLAEKLIDDEIQNGHIRGVNLRFFNVVGAGQPSLKDYSSFNLFPKVIRDIRNGKQPTIFGRNFPTQDGTCIRDYVHVEDIVDAHISAAEALQDKQIPIAINLGSGVGFSVLEIVNKIVESLKVNIEPIFANPREGDPARVVADIERAKKVLNFRPIRELDEMVVSSI